MSNHSLLVTVFITDSLWFTVPPLAAEQFGCWPPCVELPAAEGYVGTISDNLPRSTQDVSVYWIISRRSAYLTYLCLPVRTVCSGPTSSVLNT